MKITERILAPTPKLFKKLRNIGLLLLAVSGSIIGSPVSLPVLLTTVAGYLAAAGGVLSAVSQITVDESQSNNSKVKP